MIWIPSILWTLMSLHAAASVSDADGIARHPLASHGQRATVLIFVGVDCPISNGYAPELKRICTDFAGKGIDFDLVYADSTNGSKEIKKHLADYGYDCRALLDPNQKLVKMANVKVTPEVAVFDAIGIEVYHGRIDNLYADLGKKKYAATTHELRIVLDDLAANRKVTVKSTTAIGCPL